MNPPSERLEHFFSRCLDGECTPAEARLLEGLLRDRPDVRTAFEEYRRLDAAVGDALRAALGRPVVERSAAAARPPLQTPAVRVRLSRLVAIAAAACLALVPWLTARRPAAGPAGSSGQTPQVAGASWFAPRGSQSDEIAPLPRAYERPEVGVRGVQRDWLVVPGDQPGTYMVIQVDHVRTHAVRIHQDF
ncbi:MAG: hypothetical protein AB1716_16375 [Planctomycetota bacterium]